MTALSSTAIKRLYLTWAHVDREAQLEALEALNNASGNFSAYREALKAVDSACVPFMVMFLTELVRTQSQPDTTTDPSLINFSKRMRFFDTVTSMLRFQTKAFSITERAATMAFLHQELATNSDKDQDWIWGRSEEVQLEEKSDTDILAGLGKAGFGHADGLS